ncbi:glycosyltransferase family 2 protein [Geobacter sp. DSM 9736]|uniref:glycosyltransferase family 2 protein n=1 Tax=Geobacter sp. DSM 9736 TaxID=1277350 RepID=UPI000B604ECD|nr:glycosyltransferase family 2 protein [Geobacter sp. DSM 9736]SNB48124.1 Glycosyltransferase involved in cell wall bisynthesis [Geobacter sp. DSM 9736]
MNTCRQPIISVVVPCYNEDHVVDEFHRRTAPILAGVTEDFEIIFVNDGSTDGTVEKVRSLHEADPRVKLIDLSRNFGKEIAMTAGIDFAGGEAVVVMDADLQDPPELIPEMVRRWREGADVVYATRTMREGEGFIKKVTAKAFYRLIGRITRISIPEDTGDFRLMNRRSVDALKRLRERHRFMKGLFSWVGFRQVSIRYRREPRFAGTTKWNYWKLWNFAIEGITSFSIGPLQFATYFGVVTAIFAFLYAFFLVVRTLILGIDVPGYASIMVTILFFSGVQLITLGIMGEYIGRMFNETKNRPLYLVQGLLGLADDAGGEEHALVRGVLK